MPDDPGSSYPELTLLVDGQHISEGRSTAPVVNPATGTTLGHLPHASADDLHVAIAAASRAFGPWAATPPVARSAILRKTAEIIRTDGEVLADLISLELGKPRREAAREVDTTVELFEWAAEEGRRAYGRVIPARAVGTRMTAIPEPVGPVAAFAGWNAPAITPARKISGALAAGCPVIIKPSEATPASALFIARALTAAGVPDGVVNVVFGDPAGIADTLLNAPDVAMVTFTGSVPVGKQLASIAAAQLKRMVFELGGHAPVIVFPDVDVAAVAREAVAARFRNSGQVCTSPGRFYVHEDCYDTFVDRFVETAAGWRVGDPFDDATQMGPLQSARRVDTMRALIDDAEALGAKVCTGGHAIDRPGFFFAPTVLTDVALEARVANEEPFGPIAQVASFRSVDEAVALANRLSVGLASYLFSNDLRVVDRLTAAIRAGSVIVNHWTVSFPETPFGGFGDSGFGLEGGIEGLQAFQRLKFVSQRTDDPPA
ncbi:MAG: NAD-dependent succinate-semialdehyde dehydrogenase [Acidimicrobiia bacterium]